MRLHPFGESGPLVLSFAALEDYLPRTGRDWERTRWSRRGLWAIAKASMLTSCVRCCARLFPSYVELSVIQWLRNMKRG
ncbi:hypothetical protein ACNKHL_18665 [Shigella flexneri]